MCGIVGAVGRFPKTAIETALKRLAHRGPDGAHSWEDADNNVLFGHRRLAILDLTDTGKQPMVDDELTITYNGEIFNYVELKETLRQHHHTFTSHTDTEVILKAYRQWGDRFVEKLNGMWAIAIWNSKTRELFLTRDRFGVKPLFYAFSERGFVFGSEMKAITPFMDDVSISDDFHWCKENIYGYETTDKTLIKNIKRFPAGYIARLSYQSKSLGFTPYWNTLDHLETVDYSYEKQVQRFRELFFDACKIRMRSDVKIGTALSGGLDSSSVAAGMRHLGISPHSNGALPPEWQHAFVATFTGTTLDEKEYAEEVVKFLDLKGHFFEIDAMKGFNQMDEHLWLFEELFLTSPAPMIEIYRGIKANGVSVSLDGHGADELLAGYGTMIFNAVKDAPFDLVSMKDIATTYKHLREVDKSTFNLVVDGFAGRKNMLKFYLGKIFAFLQEEDPLVERLGYFNATLYKEFHYYILPTLLRNYDRYSMASGVEVRMPFLDYRLVSYCFSLPWQSKIRDGYTKSILRDAMEPYLPKKVVRRKTKIGFGTPFTDWLNGAWKPFVLDIVNSTSFKSSSVIDPKEVTVAVNDFYRNPSPGFEDGHRVWEKLMPYLWERSFFNKLKD
ncbi:MAG: asparagine synthase (glutamine-hydrolyzing) [Bacteroidota bacterium]